MKINRGLDYQERQDVREKERDRLSHWHPFYAMWPRRVASRDCRAFEWIERKMTFGPGYIWRGAYVFSIPRKHLSTEYRAIEKGSA